MLFRSYADVDADGWVDVPNTAPRWLVQSNQLPTLRWWGLVERKGNEGETKTKHSGLWRPTSEGLDFVHHGTRVPKQVFTYNDTVQGYSTETVTIRDCFADNFGALGPHRPWLVNQVIVIFNQIKTGESNGLGHCRKFFGT